MSRSLIFVLFFFFNDTATTEIYTLSLHDALPISLGVQVIWTDPACSDSRGPQPQGQWPHRRLPFADDTFDLVLARSTSFCPREVYRILKLGGTLLTAQGGTQKDAPEQKGGPGLVELLEGTSQERSQPG